MNWCKENNIQFYEFPSNGVIRNLDSRNNWSTLRNKRMSVDNFEKPNQLIDINHNIKSKLPSKEDKIFLKENVYSFQKGGRKRAIKLIQKFLNKNLNNYLKFISGPNNSDEFCSRLSPHLTNGTVSVKEVLYFIDEFKRNSDKKDVLYNKKGLAAFRSRLSWRCHFIQKLEDQPSIEYKCMHNAYEGIRENQFNELYFEAWKSGNTGFPFIDACMRSLIHSGWITFRMRAMLTSFASYDLWIDWRKSGYVLAKLFTDYEPGIHYSQLQMQSGVTGINTIRIYNPIKQSIEHDKYGTFIKKHLPELKKVPTSFIHEPWKMNLETQINSNCILGKDYPKPIVDHKKAINFARSKISSIRKKTNYNLDVKNVFEKHGSRKKRLKSKIKKTSKQLSLF